MIMMIISIIFITKPEASRTDVERGMRALDLAEAGCAYSSVCMKVYTIYNTMYIYIYIYMYIYTSLSLSIYIYILCISIYFSLYIYIYIYIAARSSGGNHLPNATCLTWVFFKLGETYIKVSMPILDTINSAQSKRDRLRQVTLDK